jgi:hypothetical protein
MENQFTDRTLATDPADDLTPDELASLDDHDPMDAPNALRLDQVPMSGEYQAAWDKAVTLFLKALPPNAHDKVKLVFTRLKQYETNESSTQQAYYDLGWVPRQKQHNLTTANTPITEKETKILFSRRQGATQFLEDLREMMLSVKSQTAVVMHVFLSKKATTAPILSEEFRIPNSTEVRHLASGEAAGGNLPTYSGNRRTALQGAGSSERSSGMAYVASTPDQLAAEAERIAHDLLARYRQQDEMHRMRRMAIKYKRLYEEEQEKREQAEKDCHAAKSHERISESITKATPLLAGVATLLGGTRGAEIGKLLLGTAAEPSPLGSPADQPAPTDPIEKNRWLIHRYVATLPQEVIQAHTNILGVFQSNPALLADVERFALQAAGYKPADSTNA